MKGLGWLLPRRRWRSSAVRPASPPYTDLTVGANPVAAEREGPKENNKNNNNDPGLPSSTVRKRRFCFPDAAWYSSDDDADADTDDNDTNNNNKSNTAYHRRALHMALDKGLPFEGIRFLVEQCPEALRTPPTASGATTARKSPLVVALEKRYPLVAIRYLVEKGPSSSLLHRGVGGALPLHVAVRGYHDEQQQVEVARYLVQKCPQSLRSQDSLGRLPLHAALEFGSPTELSWLLVQEWPASLQVKDAQGRLPVHVAAACGTPLGLLRGLIDLRPASLHAEDATGCLPLHLAVATARQRSPQTAEAAVGLLVERYPIALRVADSQGCLPLHWAAVHLSGGIDGYGGVVQAVLDACPPAAREQDSQGSLPLHLAVAAGAPTKLVRTVFRAFPMSLGHADQSGALPLHRAVASRSIYSADTARFLLEQHPEALQQVDGRGYLPLHAAVSATCGAQDPLVAWELAQLLVDGWPASVEIPSKAGSASLLPLNLAAANPAMPVDVVFALLRSWPEALIAS